MHKEPFAPSKRGTIIHHEGSNANDDCSRTVFSAPFNELLKYKKQNKTLGILSGYGDIQLNAKCDTKS